MTDHILDNPIWATLTTGHADLAIGRLSVRRFPADVSPLSAMKHVMPNAMAMFAKLFESGEVAWLVQKRHILPLPGFVEEKSGTLVQLLADEFIPLASTPDHIEPLTEDDWPEMLALAKLTEPGPFEMRTPLLGRFFGIRDRGVLVAMAGERMRVPGFTEISGVCTRRDYRGRGYAKALLSRVGSQIVADGNVPFLHAWAHNEGAIALYESFGFRIRTRLDAVAMRRTDEEFDGPPDREAAAQALQVRRA